MLFNFFQRRARHERYGPRTEQVQAVIGQAYQLDLEDVEAFRADWSMYEVAPEVADTVATATTHLFHDDLTVELQAAYDDAGAAVAAAVHGQGSWWQRLLGHAETWMAQAYPAVTAARLAVIAVLAADELDDKELQVLATPWCATALTEDEVAAFYNALYGIEEVEEEAQGGEDEDGQQPDPAHNGHTQPIAYGQIVGRRAQ